MIPQVIKSHWRIAFKSVLKAIKVTFQTAAAAVRAHKYSFTVADDLTEQRRKHEKSLISFANEYLDRMT